MWGMKYSTTRRVDPSYAPSRAFETFPLPKATARLAEIGRTLDTERREIMLRRNLGLTNLYNLVNDLRHHRFCRRRYRTDAGYPCGTRPGSHGRLRLE